MLLDIHSHHPAPYPEGIISEEPECVNFEEGQYYSLGLHPWHLGATPDEVEKQCDRLCQLAGLPQIIAIGEAGFDTVRGAPMMLQSIAFRRQVDLSEQLKLPLIIHCVKTMDMILAWRKQSGAIQPWIIHGFRGKPQASLQLIKAGIGLSFGEKFNPETMKQVPLEFMFAETDESSLSINKIIDTLSEVRQENLLPVIASNMQQLFQKNI